MITITKMTETCGGCPSQWDGWDGWDEDGAYYYFRYRWGRLRVDAASSQKDWDSPLAIAYGATPSGKSETIFDESLGQSGDGILSYDNLRISLKELLELPDIASYEDLAEQTP